MAMSNKTVPEEIKSLSGGVEEGVNLVKLAAGGPQSKITYKRYTCDFFKDEGGYMEKIDMNLPSETKKKGAKLVINGFLLAIGDSVKVDYTIAEDGHSYTYSVTLQSGDAFAVNSEVRALSFGVAEVKGKSKPKDLVLREGALLITAERD